MLDTNDLENRFKNNPDIENLIAEAAAITAREEKVKNLIAIMNTPCVVQNMERETVDEIATTLMAIAKIYNRELREDKTVSREIPEIEYADEDDIFRR